MIIKKVFWSGTLDFRRVHPLTYRATQKEIFEKFNVNLPDYKKLPEKSRSQLRMLLVPLKIEIHTVTDGVLRYGFAPGYMTDLASVPKFLRSFLDNDSLELLIAALVHDANFGAQFLSFSTSNSLFRQMIRNPGGGSWWVAFKAWLGVSSFIGRRVYDDKTTQEILREKELVRFNWGPK